MGQDRVGQEQREPREQDLVVEEGTGEPVITTLKQHYQDLPKHQVTKSIEKLDHIEKPEGTEA